jgi:hypothetical protein
MRSLITTGLIDEYVLAIHPVALGSGLPIFTDLAIPLYLKLVDVKTFPGGVIAHTYRCAATAVLRRKLRTTRPQPSRSLSGPSWKYREHRSGSGDSPVPGTAAIL